MGPRPLISRQHASRLGALVLALATASLAHACGHTRTESVGPPDGGPDAGDAGQDAGEDAGADGGADAGAADGGDAGVDAGPLPLQTARVIVHLHSPISHDACDGHSDHTGGLSTRDQDCLQQLEDGLCASKIDVAFVTDHPSYVSDQTREDALLSRPGRGETWELTDAGEEHGNRIPCANGRSVLVATGVEGTHTLPIGLTQKLPRYTVDTADGASVADLAQLKDEIHAAGGLYFTAHSEESDLPTALLQQIQSDGMEWYNPHGNFLHLWGGDGTQVGGNIDLAHLGDLIDTLKSLEPFLANGTAQPDLILLVLLNGGFPEAGVQKVHDVLSVRPIAAVLGSDVHQNVSITPVCKGTLAQAACQAAAAAYPNLLSLLLAGGQVILADGGRLDSFARILRWLNNRVLVTELSVAGAEEGLRLGRVWSLFAVFGEPGAFAVWAETGGARGELGSTVTLAGTTLHVRLPDAPAPELGAQWSPAEAATAGVRTVLWRTDAAGKAKAAEWTGTGSEVQFTPTAAGAYTVESWITPAHLTAALGSKAKDLAGFEYRWVLSSPIYVR